MVGRLSINWKGWLVFGTSQKLISSIQASYQVWIGDGQAS